MMNEDASTELFELRNADEVNVAMIAARISNAASDLCDLLGKLYENYPPELPPKDMKLVVTGSDASYYRNQAVESLEELTHNEDYPQYRLAAAHLLDILRVEED